MNNFIFLIIFDIPTLHVSKSLYIVKKEINVMEFIIIFHFNIYFYILNRIMLFVNGTRIIAVSFAVHRGAVLSENRLQSLLCSIIENGVNTNILKHN